MGQRLVHHDSKQTQLHVSVHLPYKDQNKKEESVRLLMKYLEDEEKDNGFDQFFIHGDFNAKGQVIKEWKSDLNVAVSGDTATTETGGQCDNIVTDSGGQFGFGNVNIAADCENYTHYPLAASARKRAQRSTGSAR